MAAQEWSAHDLKTHVRKNPNISIGDTTAWVVAETHGTALNLTVQYMLSGERRAKTLGSSTFHQRLGGEGGYGVEVCLTNTVFQRALEEMKAQNLANEEQWQILFEQAQKVLGDVLQAPRF